MGTRRLPNAHVGKRYSTVLAAAGGTPPYRWAAVSLPTGLSVTPAGALAGAAAKHAASLRLTVRVTDASGAQATRAARPARRARKLMLFPDHHLRDLLRDRAAHVVGADAAPRLVAGVHAGRELRLLCVVGLAVRLPARGVDRRQPRGGAGDRPDVQRQTRKLLLGLAVAFNLGLLGYFKYAGFLVSSAENALSRVGLPSSSCALSVTLPIGISFFTFMALSYVIDVYRGQLEPVDFPRFAVYLSFFPHLVAGPIGGAASCCRN